MNTLDEDTQARLARLEAELERIQKSAPVQIPTRRAPRLIALVTAVSLLVVPAAAFAGHAFTDVPNDNQFHLAIDAITGAGITAGCGGGQYCPKDAVTREQMAAFMQRGYGRVATAQGFGSNWSDLDDGVYGSVSIQTGGVAGGFGMVLVIATAAVWTDDDALCPCEATVALRREGDTNQADAPMNSTLGAGVGAGRPMTTLATTHAFVAPSGSLETFNLVGEIEGLQGTPAPETVDVFRWNLQAVYIPFESSGGNPTLPTN